MTKRFAEILKPDQRLRYKVVHVALPVTITVNSACDASYLKSSTAAPVTQLCTRPGTFTLTYKGETTDAIAYDADASEIASSVGNLSALAGSSVTAATVNCSMPEVTCSWKISFGDVYGNVDLLSSDPNGLQGNAAEVTVVEEVQGQVASDVYGSPVTVRNTRIVSSWLSSCQLHSRGILSALS